MEEIREILKKSPKKNKLLFAILCCERLYPNYVYFCKKCNWGNSEVLERSITYIYNYLKTDYISPDEIERLLFDLDAVTPNTEGFPTIFVSFAFDACTALHETLEYVLEEDNEKITNIVSFTFDTIDMFIQERDDMDYNDPKFELKIQNDSFMIKEKLRQRIELEEINNMRSFNDGNIEVLRAKNTMTKIIDLSVL